MGSAGGNGGCSRAGGPASSGSCGGGNVSRGNCGGASASQCGPRQSCHSGSNSCGNGGGRRGDVSRGSYSRGNENVSNQCPVPLCMDRAIAAHQSTLRLASSCGNYRNIFNNGCVSTGRITFTADSTWLAGNTVHSVSNYSQNVPNEPVVKDIYVIKTNHQGETRVFRYPAHLSAIGTPIGHGTHGVIETASHTFGHHLNEKRIEQQSAREKNKAQVRQRMQQQAWTRYRLNGGALDTTVNRLGSAASGVAKFPGGLRSGLLTCSATVAGAVGDAVKEGQKGAALALDKAATKVQEIIHCAWRNLS